MKNDSRLQSRLGAKVFKKYELRIVLILLCLCPMILYGQNTLSTLGDMHSVSKGETWESVAASHNISVLELQSANPDVTGKKLKKGLLLIIPKSPQSQDPSEGEDSVTSAQVKDTLVRTSISDLKVGVLLPFGEEKMVEFYRGLLMAADSVRKSGVNLDIHTWDCGTTVAQVESILPEIRGIDILIGPTSATQIPPVAEVCREQGTRLILPFWSGQFLQDYPLVYYATAPQPIVYNAAVKKLKSYYSTENYVIVHSGTPNNRGKALCEALTQSLAQHTSVPRTLEIEGDDFAYESAFNQFRHNMILLDDSSIRSLNILLSHLKDFRQKHPQYRLSLLGYPEWQEETQRLLTDFFSFDSYIISPYYYNVLDERTKRFQRAYEKFFHTPISQGNPRPAAFGYDLGLYFLGGICSLGDTFEQKQSSLQQQPYQNWFLFERSATGMCFSNSFVQFIHFTPENKIEVIR